VRVDVFLRAAGTALLGASVVMTPITPAGATFAGSNGVLAWAAICGVNGQQLWTEPNTTTGATCPGAGSPVYSQLTAGSADSMPYFDSDGGEVYFSSNRVTAGNAIFEIPYPSNGVSPDNASQLTQTATSVYASSAAGPSGYDYVPTVAADTSGPQSPPFMLFIHCATTAATTGCGLDKLSPVSASGTVSVVPVASSQPVLGPTNSNGDGPGNRPEVDPVNPDLVLYVDAANHIHEMSLSGATLPGNSTGDSTALSDVDLSFNSGIATALNGGPAADEHPDWAPDGQAVVFDSTRPPTAATTCSGGTGTTPGANTVFTMSNLGASPTVAQVWAKLVCGYAQIEPVYAPADTYDTTAAGPPSGNTPHVAPTLAWVALNHGSNIQTIDDGSSVGTPVFATQNATNNSEVIWQPTPPGAILPEAPYTFLLPASGAFLLGGGIVIGRRRRRRVLQAA
jgi:hypothetical protein